MASTLDDILDTVVAQQSRTLLVRCDNCSAFTRMHDDGTRTVDPTNGVKRAAQDPPEAVTPLTAGGVGLRKARFSVDDHAVIQLGSDVGWIPCTVTKAASSRRGCHPAPCVVKAPRSLASLTQSPVLVGPATNSDSDVGLCHFM